MVSPAIRKFALVGVCFLLTCCALVKPDRHLDEVTPIDWGLDNSFESAITIQTFDSQDENWGIYAANRIKQHLLESSAFRRVIYSDKGPVTTPYVLTGELEYLYYGGTVSPSRVCISVRITDTKDNQTRFMRVSRASSGKDAFHVGWLSRVYVPSPYPEELLDALLKHIAGDIAERTVLPPKKCP
jgi:hypothetical protein